jgi:hypothetical protein
MNRSGEIRNSGPDGKLDAIAELPAAGCRWSRMRAWCKVDGRWDIKGDPTEGALVVAAAKAGIGKKELDRHVSPPARNPLYI